MALSIFCLLLVKFCHLDHLLPILPGYGKLLGKPISQDSTSSESRVVEKPSPPDAFRPGLEARAAVDPTVLGTMETARAWPSQTVTGTASSVERQGSKQFRFSTEKVAKCLGSRRSQENLETCKNWE